MDSQMKQALFSIVGLLVLCAALVAGISLWLGGDATPPDAVVSDTQSEEFELEEPLPAEELEDYDVDISNRMNPVAVLETNKGVIEIELYDDAMPITAGNFMKLVNEGFYDGIKFHRVMEGFMVQGGDPITKTDEVGRYGTGDPGYAIPDEHIAGDKLTNVRGTISMANSGPDSGGSQFFINLVDNTNLDFDKPPLQSKHPVFGQVIAGMDVVDEIAATETGPTNLPLEDIVIEKATIRE
jgi:peptidylprolyl isomerase